MADPARQASPAGPEWRRPLIVAAVTLVLAILVLVIGYERMSSDANGDAASHSTQGRAFKRAASQTPAGSGSRQQVPAAPPAAGQNP